jgi:hypothetical protein
VISIRSKSRGTVPKAYFNRVTCAPPPPRRTFSALNLMVFTTELKPLIIKIYSFFFLLSPIILIKHSDAPRRRNKGTLNQLVEIAKRVIVQEWSELKNNQRLDFFVLLFQDKRTKKIRSDFFRQGGRQ